MPISHQSLLMIPRNRHELNSKLYNYMSLVYSVSTIDTSVTVHNKTNK